MTDNNHDFDYISFLEFVNKHFDNINIDDYDMTIIKSGKQNYDQRLIKKIINCYIQKYKLSTLQNSNSTIKYDKDLWRLFLIKSSIIIYVEDLQLFYSRVFNVISD